MLKYDNWMTVYFKESGQALLRRNKQAPLICSYMYPYNANKYIIFIVSNL